MRREAWSAESTTHDLGGHHDTKLLSDAPALRVKQPSMSGDTLRMRLRLHPSQRGPAIIAAGRLDQSTVDTLHQVITAALSLRGAETLTLHLAQITFIDVAGVAALVECHRQADLAGVTFAISYASATVSAALRVCQLHHLLPAAPILLSLPVLCLTSRRRTGGNRRTSRRFCPQPPAP